MGDDLRDRPDNQFGWVRAVGVNNRGGRDTVYLELTPVGVTATVTRTFPRGEYELIMGKVVPGEVRFDDSMMIFRVNGQRETGFVDGGSQERPGHSYHKVALSDRVLLERLRPFFDNATVNDLLRPGPLPVPAPAA